MRTGTPSRLQALRLNGDGGQIEVLAAREPEARFSAHWHAEWSLGAIGSGRCDFACDGRRYGAVEGDLIVMRPMSVHTASVSARTFEMTMLYLPPAWVHRLLDWGVGSVPKDVTVVRHEPSLAVSLAIAVRERRVEELAGLIGRGLRGAVSAEMVEATAEREDPRVDALCRALGALDSTCLDLDALARRLGMSREHMHRLFRRVVGLTPREYSRVARLHRAKTMLGAGTPAAEVAIECGFVDQAHFSRWFRKMFGVTPGMYTA